MLKKHAVMGILGALCLAVVMTGCEGDDDNGPKGTGVIQGNLTSVAPQVPAAVQGITVELIGPVNRSTVTAEDGMFKFENLPAGEYRLVFHIDGKTVERTVTLAEGQNLVYASVTISATGEVAVVLTVNGGSDDDSEESETDVFDLAGDWLFFFDDGSATWRHESTIAQSGISLTGTMDEGEVVRRAASGYSFIGTTRGSSVNLEFTIVLTVMPPEPIIKTATGNVSTLVPAVDVGATGQYMSGTWVGTLGETGTWEATRPTL